MLNSITRMIGDRDNDDDALSPTLSFYFVRLAETLAAYVMLYEHIGSSRLLPITPSDLMTPVWDLINHKKAWRDIAGRKNVEKLFRAFEFPAPPSHPPPERPSTTDRGGPTPRGPRGAGPLPAPSGGDDDYDEFDGWPVQRRSGQISIRDLPSNNSRGQLR